MTPVEYALEGVSDALNRLALAVTALVIMLIILSWTYEDIALHVHLLGASLRRILSQTRSDARPPTPAAPAAQEGSNETNG